MKTRGLGLLQEPRAGRGKQALPSCGSLEDRWAGGHAPLFPTLLGDRRQPPAAWRGLSLSGFLLLIGWC